MPQDFTKEFIRNYIGNESQLFGIKSYAFNEGRKKIQRCSRSIPALDLGLRLPDRCMDI